MMFWGGGWIFVGKHEMKKRHDKRTTCGYDGEKEYLDVYDEEI
jgi:hypothetical protein